MPKSRRRQGEFHDVHNQRPKILSLIKRAGTSIMDEVPARNWRLAGYSGDFVRLGIFIIRPCDVKVVQQIGERIGTNHGNGPNMFHSNLQGNC